MTEITKFVFILLLFVLDKCYKRYYDCYPSDILVVSQTLDSEEKSS